MSALLQVVGAVVDRQGRRLVDGVNLEVASGEMIGVLGPNGAGKTSLLRSALGVWPLTGGASRLSGHDVSALSPGAKARLAAYLPQDRRLAWNMAAREVAALGAPQLPASRAAAAAEAALDRVGLSALASRGVLDMSGGERARVLLARLFVTGAPLLVADEPAAGLDPDAQLLVLDLLRDHARGGGGVVVTLHDLSLAARWCDRLVVLHHGRVAATGPAAEALSPDVLASVFGLAGRLVDTDAGPVLAARRKESAA